MGRRREDEPFSPGTPMHVYFFISLIYPTLEYRTVSFLEDDENTDSTLVRLHKHYCFSVSSINLTLESALPPPALALPSQRRNLHPIPANRDDGQCKGTRTTACL